MSTDSLHLSLTKAIYFPGDVVTGTLVAKATDMQSCDAISVSLCGIGQCTFNIGKGNTKQSHYHSITYANCKKTVWGSVFSTPLVHNTGESAVFGPPWAPLEGVINILTQQHHNQVILRVIKHCSSGSSSSSSSRKSMKSDNDVVLGEVCLNVREYIHDGNMITLPLSCYGKPTEYKGQISFTTGIINIDEDSGSRTLRLQIHTITGLRKPRWVGQQSLYVQAYVTQSKVLKNRALPPPNSTGNSATLPLGEMIFPFSFTLPDGLPSSMVTCHSCNCIAYCIHAEMYTSPRTCTDNAIAEVETNNATNYQSNNTTRKYFTVIQPHPSAAFMRPMCDQIQQTVSPRIGCFPCVFSSPAGNVTLFVATDRTAYAPGEMIRFSYSTECEPPEAKRHVNSVTVRLIQWVTLRAGFHHSTLRIPIGADTIINVKEIGAQSTDDKGGDVEDTRSKSHLITVPSTAPTYMGGLGHDEEWTERITRYGYHNILCDLDPIVWKYTLEVVVNVNVPGLMSCYEASSACQLPIVITGMGLDILPALAADNVGWSNVITHETAVTTAARCAGVFNDCDDYDAGDGDGDQPFHTATLSTEPDATTSSLSWRDKPQVLRALPLLHRSRSVPFVGRVAPIEDSMRCGDGSVVSDEKSILYKPNYYVSGYAGSSKSDS